VKFEAERKWIEERMQAINEEMGQLNWESEAIASLQQIKDKFYQRLDELTEHEWRELFIRLNLQLHVGQNPESGSAELSLSSPDVRISYFRGMRDFEELQKLQGRPPEVEVRIGLPLREIQDMVSNIVFKDPLPNHSPF
jgi:hypothetical protein